MFFSVLIILHSIPWKLPVLFLRGKPYQWHRATWLFSYGHIRKCFLVGELKGLGRTTWAAHIALLENAHAVPADGNLKDHLEIFTIAHAWRTCLYWCLNFQELMKRHGYRSESWSVRTSNPHCWFLLSVHFLVIMGVWYLLSLDDIVTSTTAGAHVIECRSTSGFMDANSMSVAKHRSRCWSISLLAAQDHRRSISIPRRVSSSYSSLHSITTLFGCF